MQKNIKKPLGRRLLDFFLKTWIVASLCSFTSALYKKIAESLSCAIFTSYEKVSALLQKSATAKTLAKNSGANARSKGFSAHEIARLYERSLFSAVISKIKWAFLNCQLNVLALFGITFGFTSALMLILENFAFSITKITFRGILNLINPLMTSLVFVIISILFMFSKKPLIRAVNESLFFSFVLFDFLSIRKETGV